jgi:hypothetical protein
MASTRISLASRGGSPALRRRWRSQAPGVNRSTARHRELTFALQFRWAQRVCHRRRQVWAVAADLLTKVSAFVRRALSCKALFIVEPTLERLDVRRERFCTGGFAPAPGRCPEGLSSRGANLEAQLCGLAIVSRPRSPFTTASPQAFSFEPIPSSALEDARRRSTGHAASPHRLGRSLKCVEYGADTRRSARGQTADTSTDQTSCYGRCALRLATRRDRRH